MNVERDYCEMKTPIQVDNTTITVTEEELENFAKDYGFQVNSKLSADERIQMLQLLYRYRDVFARTIADIKRCPNYELSITLKPGARPYYQRQHPLSPSNAQECQTNYGILRGRNGGKK